MRHIVSGLLIGTLILQGCGKPGRHSHGSSGQLVAEYPGRRKPVFGWTRIPAVYVLYSQRNRPPDQPAAVEARVGWKLTSIRLEKGTPLGFKSVNGGVIAVAGGDELTLPPGLYCWHTEPNTEPIDWGATVLCVALVGAAVVGVLAVVALSQFDGVTFGPIQYPG